MNDQSDSWSDDSNDTDNNGWGNVEQIEVNDCGVLGTTQNFITPQTRDRFERDQKEFKLLPNLFFQQINANNDMFITVTFGFPTSLLNMSSEQLLALGIECNISDTIAIEAKTNSMSTAPRPSSLQTMNDTGRGALLDIIDVTLKLTDEYFKTPRNVQVLSVHFDSRPFKLSFPITKRLQNDWLKMISKQPKSYYNLYDIETIIENTQCSLQVAHQYLTQCKGDILKAIDMIKLIKQRHGNSNHDNNLSQLWHNPFVYLIDCIQNYLVNIRHRCLICDKELVYTGFKPGICDKSLCGYAYETNGLGVDVAGEIMAQPELMDLQITLMINAFHAERLIFVKYEIDGEVIEFKQMVEILEEHCPSIEEMQEVIKTRISDPRGLSPPASLKEYLGMKHKFLYDILRWIITSNRSYIRLLQPHELLKNAKTDIQFCMFSDTPEKEHVFSQQQKNRGHFFAFHGSDLGNWFSIIRTGLKNLSNTQYMTTGAVHGKGIYLSPSASVSAQYIRGSGVLWKNSRWQGHLRCLALCEVAGNDKTKTTDIYVIPDAQRVVTRYLLLYYNSYVPSVFVNDIIEPREEK